MKLRPIALLTILAPLALLAACIDDPTDEGNGEPEAIVTDFSERHLAVNAPSSITAYAVDRNLARIPGILTATSTGAAVVVDSVTYSPELQETTVHLKATAASTAGTDVTVSGHGLTKTVKIIS